MIGTMSLKKLQNLMKEIGSFIELELPKGKELYHGDNVVRLNTGRAAIWHAFRLTGAKAIWLPYYQCETVRDFFARKNCLIKYYHIDNAFNPIDIMQDDDDAVVLVNYYGIMSYDRMKNLSSLYQNVIIDNSQAFFCKPIEHAYNVYSARKFVGVADGAYVVGDRVDRYYDEYGQGFSSDTASFLLKRIEYGCAGKGYEARQINESRIDTEDIMKMSPLTAAMLDGADYELNKSKRKANFRYAHSLLKDLNCIDPLQYFDEMTVPMVYPLVVENDVLLSSLLAARHFQGHWWKYITEELPDNTFEHWLSRYVIPITIDQRYGKAEIDYLYSIIASSLK